MSNMFNKKLTNLVGNKCNNVAKPNNNNGTDAAIWRISRY